MPARSSAVTTPAVVEELEVVPAPAVLGRGHTITVKATILRVNGPWVDVSVLGELVHIFRSRLEKELTDG